jgi:hypothetical protein
MEDERLALEFGDVGAAPVLSTRISGHWLSRKNALLDGRCTGVLQEAANRLIGAFFC